MILGSCSSGRHFRQMHLAIALFLDFLSDEAEEAGKLHCGQDKPPGFAACERLRARGYAERGFGREGRAGDRDR